MHGPARVARIGLERERGIAAEFISELDRHRLPGEASRVDPGEEAAPAAASAAGLEAERLAADRNSRVGAEAARIAQAEAQLGAGQVHLRRLDSGAREIRREGEAGAPADLRVVQDGFVDR